MAILFRQRYKHIRIAPEMFTFPGRFWSYFLPLVTPMAMHRIPSRIPAARKRR